MTWDNAEPFENQVRSAFMSGTIEAMHNLMNISVLRSAVVGVIPVRKIEREP
jgi:hypothetical protein